MFMNQFSQHQQDLMRLKEETHMQEQIANAIEQEKNLKRAQDKANAQLYSTAWIEQARIKKMEENLNQPVLNKWESRIKPK